MCTYADLDLDLEILVNVWSIGPSEQSLMHMGALGASDDE